MSNKEPRKQVTEQDIVDIPKVIRGFEPVETNKNTKIWRVQRADGEMLEYVFRTVDTENNISRTLSTYVLEDSLRTKPEKQELSRQKTPESPAGRK